jgi:hypothetical protein
VFLQDLAKVDAKLKGKCTSYRATFSSPIEETSKDRLMAFEIFKNFFCIQLRQMENPEAEFPNF